LSGLRSEEVEEILEKITHEVAANDIASKKYLFSLPFTK